MTDHPIAGDILHGVKEIARFLGLTPRQTYHLTYSKTIPHFYIGTVITARKSVLTKWLAEREAIGASER